MHDRQCGRVPDPQDELAQEGPAILVGLLHSAEELFDWVAVGAEEEGVPCRRLEATAADAVALAYAAAQRSRLGVGVAITGKLVVVHEAHMPAAHAVLVYELSGSPSDVCRLAGCNAARLVVRLPFRLAEEAQERIMTQ